ncbi:hypothetical protein D9757_000504 [Collybiopsis confluens]|uniref:F-box domain-containing protein n=1 Tax=Collybiopsis confluens TaxID=2823264 RepID=A0A8H5MGV3_9AGAR|nr:hypothetical protein D9757_000504 [Collybiopsis confluens]
MTRTIIVYTLPTAYDMLDSELLPKLIKGHDIKLEMPIMREEATDLWIVNIQSRLSFRRRTNANSQKVVIPDQLQTDLGPSPIQLLPLELLSYIFLLSVEPSLFPNTVASALTLSRVCSVWRATVATDPRLWSSTSIHIVPNQKWRDLLILLSTRSGDRPLSLELIWHPTRGDKEYNISISNTLYRQLPLLSPRWHRLQLFVPLDIVALILDYAPLPNLEFLSLGSECEEPPVLNWTQLDHAPNLRTLSFAALRSRPIWWDMPWSQLTELNSKSLLSGPQAVFLLSRCPNLERCQLRVESARFEHEEEDEDVLVVVPKLKSLSLVLGGFDDIWRLFGLFRRLVFPSLDRLEFRDAVQNDSVVGGLYKKHYWVGEFLVPLLDRSECSLEAFRVVLVGGSSHIELGFEGGTLVDRSRTRE